MLQKKKVEERDKPMKKIQIVIYSFARSTVVDRLLKDIGFEHNAIVEDTLANVIEKLLDKKLNVMICGDSGRSPYTLIYVDEKRFRQR